MVYANVEDIDDEVLARELPHYIGGIINEIKQWEDGGYSDYTFIKKQLRGIEHILRMRIEEE